MATIWADWTATEPIADAFCATHAAIDIAAEIVDCTPIAISAGRKTARMSAATIWIGVRLASTHSAADFSAGTSVPEIQPPTVVTAGPRVLDRNAATVVIAGIRYWPRTLTASCCAVRRNVCRFPDAVDPMVCSIR